jgi:hypothetical protein
MSQPGDRPDRDRSLRVFNLTLAAVAGQAGCLTLVVIFAALFLGLWLDNRFDTRPLLTVVLMVASVPVTLVLMFWVVRKTTARLNTASKGENQSQEEGVDGKSTP